MAVGPPASRGRPAWRSAPGAFTCSSCKAPVYVRDADVWYAGSTRLKMVSEEYIISIVDLYLSEQEGGREAIVSEVAAKLADPEWALVPLRIVIVLRDRHSFKEVAEVADMILKHGGVSDEVAFDVCWNACIAGHPERVVDHLQRSFERGVLSGDQMLFLSVQQTRVGNHDKAAEVLNAVERQFEHLRNEVGIHRQFFDFYKNYGPDTAWALFEDVKSKFAAASIDIVERNIRSALDEKRPFLLLRLGDGEGSVMRINQDDTNKYGAYYAANQKEFLKIWFEDESVGASDRFDKVIDDFNAVIHKADMIGGIYDAAIVHEYRLGSRRGIAWIVNTMRKVLLLAERDPDWASRTSIHHLGLHYDLLLSGTLARLLQDRAHVGVVSCQSELPAALKRTYGIGEVEFYKVPGEQIHRATLGDSAVEGAHWPDRFFELCETFDRGVDRRGQLFLVAAGMLGKIYASKLKAAGAVVLDIGAVADLWMGKITRTFPYLPDEVALRLDPDEALTVVQVGGMSDLSLGQQTQSVGGALTVFEPNPERYEQAKAFFAERGLKVMLIGKGLSDASGSRRFHVAKSLGCSSILEPNEEILGRYSVGPAFRTVRSIDVECVRYDELLAAGDVSIPDVLLLSAQGFDGEVLDGFGDILRHCLGVKVRTYLYEVYKNQKLMPDIVKQLDKYGFILRRMAPNDNFDGGIVEIDAWFTRPIWQFPGLNDGERTKLERLERAWDLPSQRIMFSESQFN